tara:strand:- start:291 stop:407 length:117 start_codon:yes stop_codon:yes gene_type:complete
MPGRCVAMNEKADISGANQISGGQDGRIVLADKMGRLA